MKNGIFFKGFKKSIINRFGKEKGNEIWKKAESNCERLISEFPGAKGDGVNMYGAAAIYLAVREYDGENALPFLKECGAQAGIRLRKTVHRLTSVPFVPELLWKNMPSVMRRASGEKKGYTRRIVSETNELVAVDILTCPIYDAAAAMGVPEAAGIICAMDKEYMSGLKHINYTRTMSVAEGGECCDYRMSYDKSKK